MGGKVAESMLVSKTQPCSHKMNCFAKYFSNSVFRVYIPYELNIFKALVGDFKGRGGKCLNKRKFAINLPLPLNPYILPFYIRTSFCIFMPATTSHTGAYRETQKGGATERGANIEKNTQF